MAESFKALRELGFNINSRWIDVQDVLSGPEDTYKEYMSDDHLRNIWDNGCKIDCLNCDVMILAVHPRDGNTHAGALVELGHVTALGKRVYVLGNCDSFMKSPTSDKAFMQQDVVTHWPEVDTSNFNELAKAFHRAVLHAKRAA